MVFVPMRVCFAWWVTRFRHFCRHLHLRYDLFRTYLESQLLHTLVSDKIGMTIHESDTQPHDARQCSAAHEVVNASGLSPLRRDVGLNFGVNLCLDVGIPCEQPGKPLQPGGRGVTFGQDETRRNRSEACTYADLGSSSILCLISGDCTNASAIWTNFKSRSEAACVPPRARTEESRSATAMTVSSRDQNPPLYSS
jgi:hypothetical protein